MVFLLTYFICRVNMIVGMFTWVRERDHGYGYGYNVMGMGMGMGTSPACQEATGTMGTGTNFRIR